MWLTENKRTIDAFHGHLSSWEISLCYRQLGSSMRCCIKRNICICKCITFAWEVCRTILADGFIRALSQNGGSFKLLADNVWKVSNCD